MGERLAPSQIVLTNFRVHRNQLNNGLRVRGRERVESGVGREGAGDHVNDEGKFEMARNALLHRNSTYIYQHQIRRGECRVLMVLEERQQNSVFSMVEEWDTNL